MKRPSDGDYLTAVVDLLRPLSRGQVTLKSSDPLVNPVINENFCAHPLDIVGLREGIRFTDELLRRGDGMKDVVGEAYPEALPLDSDEKMQEEILKRVTTGYRESILKPIAGDELVLTHRCRPLRNLSYGQEH